jgi:copper chaperone CopZ
MTPHDHEPERLSARRPKAAVAHLDIAGMHCERCPTLIGRVLSRVGGVHLAVVSLDTQIAVVTYDPRFTFPSRLLQAVAAAPQVGRSRFAGTLRRISSPDGGDSSRSAPRGRSAEDVVPGDTVAPTVHPVLEGSATQQLWQLVSGLEATAGRLRSLLCHVLENRHGRAVVASSYDLPPQLLTGLAAADDDEVCLAVAGNPATPAAVLEHMATHWACHTALAGNPSAPPALLARLAADWDPSVRRAVARNSSTPTDLLDELGCDADAGVRAAVATNRPR